MNASAAKLKAFTDAAADRVARSIAAIEREARRERELRDAEHRALCAEWQTRIAAVADLERRLGERLASVKDGDSVVIEDVLTVLARQLREHVERALSEWERPQDGKSVTVEQLAPMVAETVNKAVAALPKPKDGEPGKSIKIDDVASMIEEQARHAVAALPPGEPGRDGKDADPETVADLVYEKAAADFGILSERIDGVVLNAQEVALRHEAKIKEVTVCLPDLIADAVAAIPPAEDGKSVTVDDVTPMIEDCVAKAVAALPKPEKGEPGASLTLDDVRPLIQETIAKAVSELPAPKNGEPGKSVTAEDVQPMIAELVSDAVAAVPVPKDGAPGKLSIVNAWEDRVYYEAEVAFCDGSTFQARKDTAKRPPHADWQCLAAAGTPGRSPRVRETYDPDVTDYAELDIVALNGAGFIARHDDPGPCPGKGWKLIAMQGKPGRPGEKQKGDPGPAGPKVAGMEISDEAMLTLTNADGSKVECDLYPILSKIDRG